LKNVEKHCAIPFHVFYFFPPAVRHTLFLRAVFVLFFFFFFVHAAQKTLEIKLLVTFNEKAGFLNRIRTSRRGRNALCYQQALARILKVLAANLNKTLTVESK
jgi:hypothetical protein